MKIGSRFIIVAPKDTDYSHIVDKIKKSRSNCEIETYHTITRDNLSVLQMDFSSDKIKTHNLKGYSYSDKDLSSFDRFLFIIEIINPNTSEKIPTSFEITGLNKNISSTPICTLSLRLNLADDYIHCFQNLCTRENRLTTYDFGILEALLHTDYNVYPSEFEEILSAIDSFNTPLF